MNPENKCAHLFNACNEEIDAIDPSQDLLDIMVSMQASLQQRVGNDPEEMTFIERVNFIKENWNYLSCEYAELLERLPFKTWKNYTDEQKAGFIDEEHKLEVWYEYIDIFHFFINIGLCLGLDAETMFKLYYTKNKENFDRQNRGY